jgi:penicillin-binding protein 1A
VLDMAHAYETFATRGLRVDGTLAAPNDGPVGIKEIEEPGRRTRTNHRRTQRVLSPETADTATSIMRTVVSKGTGHRAQYGGFAAGKTGTTENNVDAWFVGFSRDITVAVWVGYPDSGKPMTHEWMGEPVEGGTYPAAIWGDFLRRATAILDRRDPGREKQQRGDSDVPVGGAEPDVSSTPTTTSATGSETGADGSAATSTDPGTDDGAGSGSAAPSGTADGGAADGGDGGAATPAPSTPVTPPSGTGSGSGTGSSGSGDGTSGTGSTGSGSGTGSGSSGSGGDGGTSGAVPLG